jgi:pimeloyl-ACP methyl ester carboxylesterase
MTTHANHREKMTSDPDRKNRRTVGLQRSSLLLVLGLSASAVLGCAHQDSAEREEEIATSVTALAPSLGVLTYENRFPTGQVFQSGISKPVLNHDGSILLFNELTSGTPPLATDKNTNPDIYVRQRNNNALTLLSSLSEQGRVNTFAPMALDSSGRYAVVIGAPYHSYFATPYSLLLWDRIANTTAVIDSGNSTAITRDNGVISADGSTVAYVNRDNYLAVYQRTTATSQTVLGPTGQPIRLNANSSVAINGNGKLLTFTANANEVISGLPAQPALFVADRSVGTVTPIRTADNRLIEAHRSTISSDGRTIAFEAYPHVVLGGTTFNFDRIWIYDRATGAIKRVDCPTLNGACDPSQPEQQASSLMPALSADGSRVAFTSNLSNLVSGDTNNTYDVFVTGTKKIEIARASVSTYGAEANGSSSALALSRDGNTICFSSIATNLQSAYTTTPASSAIFCRSLLPPPPFAGTVTGWNGLAISGATVEIDGRVTTTDAGGNYSFAGLAPGKYTVHVRKDGWTFGSESFMTDNLTVDTTTTNSLTVKGYNKNPIVYVRGFADQGTVPNLYTFKNAGYRTYDAPILNSFGNSTDTRYNASILADTITKAKRETGQDKVVVVAYSMGGIISRAYLEDSYEYRGDVSQFFDYGSPHWGFPASLDLLTLASTGVSTLFGFDMQGITDLTYVPRLLFNLTHFDRAPGVKYHFIGGDAPMWRTVTLKTFRIFGRKFRISVPWVDLRFRNAWGWAMGAIIPGCRDDALFNTYSTTLLWGGIDRYVTREAHSSPLANRWYGSWDGRESQETYAMCLKTVLIDGITHCGAYLTTAPPENISSGSSAPREVEPSNDDEPVTLNALTSPSTGLLHPNETIRREIDIEGGTVNLGAFWQSGSARVTLIDPSGQTITPELAASQEVADDPNAPIETTVDPNIVAHTSSAVSSSYSFPNAKPGKWTVIIVGGSDIPAAGVPYTSSAQLASTLTLSAGADRIWYAPNATATFTATLSEAVQSATVTGVVRLASGSTRNVTFSAIGNNQYRGTLTVPSEGGDASLQVTVKGRNSKGVAFERGSSQSFKIMVSTVSLTGTYSETAVVSPRRPDKYSALNVVTGVSATRPSKVTVTAQLVDSAGNQVARTTTEAHLVTGTNAITLPFSGTDIAASGKNGPYRVTNVLVVDHTTGVQEVAVQSNNVRTTASYAYTSFEANVYENHSYEAFAGPVSWPTAKAACEAKKGHLVTISSPGENSYVSKISKSIARVWLGISDTDAEGYWKSVTGESTWYSKWDSNEPNNYGGAEHWGSMYVATGGWNDLPSTWSVGYVCEWEPQKTAWTAWLNRDDAWGGGDNESLGYFLQSGLACAKPAAIECRRTSDQRDWRGTDNIMTCSPTEGGNCINAYQTDGACDDFEVRFACPVTP